MNFTFSKAAAISAIGMTMVLAACDKPNLGNDKGKYSYAIGAQIAKNLKTQNIDLDIASFNAAVKDVMTDQKAKLTDDEKMQALRKMSESLQAKEKAMGEENLKKGQEFLDANKSKEGWKVTESGLQYKMITEGTGKAPKGDDTVEVHYKGTLIDGKQFDSSYDRKEPAKFPVKGVIPGWTEALQLMKEGSKYELAIPPGLAYGDRGNPSIPANSVLLFEVELLKVMPPVEDPSAKKPKGKK